jgi:hypothetical protein
MTDNTPRRGHRMQRRCPAHTHRFGTLDSRNKVAPGPRRPSRPRPRHSRHQSRRSRHQSRRYQRRAPIHRRWRVLRSTDRHTPEQRKILGTTKQLVFAKRAPFAVIGKPHFQS